MTFRRHINRNSDIRSIFRPHRATPCSVSRDVRAESEVPRVGARLPQTRLLLPRLSLAQLHLAQRHLTLNHMCWTARSPTATASEKNVAQRIVASPPCDIESGRSLAAFELPAFEFEIDLALASASPNYTSFFLGTRALI